jgi:hypothetical protein
VRAARTDAHAQLALCTNSTDQPSVKPAAAPAHHGAPPAVYRAVRSTIVSPTDVRVLDPVPERPGVAPAEAWLTLTSCQPKYGSMNPYIVFAKLDRAVPRADGPGPDVITAGGG